MSGAGEHRWRRQGQGNRPNQDRSGTSTPTREGPRQQATQAPAQSGGAWGGKGKAVGTAQASTPAERHISVRDFNATEVKDFLRKKYLESIADQPSVFHKVQGDSVAKRSSGAWGSRGNMSHLMPSGQDFFTQLKKQLMTVDPKKPTQ